MGGMKVMISGGTGLVGKALTDALISRGDQVVILSRSQHGSGENIEFKKWDITNSKIESGAFNKVDAVVNLAGSPIAQKWNSKGRKSIYNSRIESTQLLVNEM